MPPLIVCCSAAGAAPPRSPGPWHLQTPTLCHTAALSWFRGTARGLWRLPLGSYQISYQGNLSFFLRRRNTNLSSPWILYIDIKTYKEKFCTQDLFINLLYGTLILWRSYEGWDLSSSIKGLFYYQHVDCGYYCVACRCIVCRPCSSHQPTDQRGQVADCRDRAPCCSAAVSPGSCSLLLYIMRSLRSLEAEQQEYHNTSRPIQLTTIIAFS